MGMFDVMSTNLTSRIISSCPVCKESFLNNEDVEWQTKDFSCILWTRELSDIVYFDKGEYIPHEMHTICPHCNEYMSVLYDINEDSVFVKAKDLQLTLDIYDKSLIDDYRHLCAEYRQKQSKTMPEDNYLLEKSLDTAALEEKMRNYLSATVPNTVIKSIIKDMSNNYYIIPKE